MARGLTDKESLEITLRESREKRATWARVKALAERGAKDPQQLTAAETQDLCSSLVRLLDKPDTP
jgi:hypothetical protein